MDDLKRYEELVKTIEYHNDRYYNQDDPEISDYEYDMMMKELKKIENIKKVKKMYFREEKFGVKNVLSYSEKRWFKIQRFRYKRS